MAMGAIVLPDFSGRLTAGAELLEAIMVDPNGVMLPIKMAPRPETERREACPESNELLSRNAICGRGRKQKRWVVWRGPRAVNAPRVIGWHINNVGVCRFNHYLLIRVETACCGVEASEPAA